MARKSDCMFSTEAEEWLRHLSPELKASSEGRYRNILYNHLLPVFGTRYITEITWTRAEAFRQQLLQQEPPLSPRTVAGILSVLKRVLNYAFKNSGQPPADLSGLTVRQTSKPLRVLTLEEQQRLTRYLLQRKTLPGAGMLLSLYTGLRIGEICALKWESISFEENCLYVQKTMQRVQIIPERNLGLKTDSARTAIMINAPKSACSNRTIPLPDLIAEGLKPLSAPPECYFLTGQPYRFMEPRTLE